MNPGRPVRETIPITIKSIFIVEGFLQTAHGARQCLTDFDCGQLRAIGSSESNSTPEYQPAISAGVVDEKHPFKLLHFISRNYVFIKRAVNLILADIAG